MLCNYFWQRWVGGDYIIFPNPPCNFTGLRSFISLQTTTLNILSLMIKGLLLEIDTNIISPFLIPDFPPGSHVYDPRRENLIDGINKDMIDPLRAQADFWEYQESIGVHDEVYTDGSKVNERVGAAAAVRRHFRNGETTERHFLKRLPDGSSIFAAEATAIEMALEYYSVMPAVGHDVVVYSDSMSCLQAIDGEDTEQPFICRIMNLLWRLHDKGTNVRFCWLPSHRGIEGNEVADRLAREALDQDVDPLLKVHYSDLKPLVNTYIQGLAQIKWDVSVHGRDMYQRHSSTLLEQRRAIKSHVISRGPPATCQHCAEILTVDHMLLECVALQEMREEYYNTDSIKILFETIPEVCIVEFLREAGFYQLI